MPPLTSDLDQIVAHLRRLGRRAPELLQPPLSEAEIRTLEATLPFALTGELDSIYQWRNGTRAEEGDLLQDLYLFPGFYFLSLEEAISTYHERENAPQWKHGWFPLFADGGGDFYIVPCTKRKVETRRIIGFIHGEPEQVAEYESLASMVQTLEACFRAGAFYVDEDDTMEIDDDAHRAIAHRFNPSIREWQN